MATKTKTQLAASAVVIKNETNAGANTATRVGTFLEDITDSVNVIVPFTRTLTQAEVRTLNSANGGYGIELLPASGVGNIYAINNVYIKYELTGGAFASADIWVYNFSQSGAEYMGSTNSLAALGTYYEHLVQEQDTYISSNDKIYIYSSVEQSAFEGAWVVSFDYTIKTL